jgi:co-chaperonin GroES (HSP10)
MANGEIQQEIPGFASDPVETTPNSRPLGRLALSSWIGVRPREDQVLMRLVGPATSEGGIHLPTAHQSDSRLAQVVAVGEGWYQDGELCPITNCSPGDFVVVRPNRGTPVQINGETLLIASCHEIPLVVVPLEPGHPAPTVR